MKEAIKIEVDGFTWYYQEFENDGVNLYDNDGELVCDFSSCSEMLHFLKGATQMIKIG